MAILSGLSRKKERRKDGNISFYPMLVLALAGFAVIFIIQNVAAVEVNFLLWTLSISRALLIFFTLSIGFLLGWFLHSYYSYRRSKPTAPDD